LKLVLKPYWIAEECFLKEAILWVAFYRFPTSEIIPDHVDVRFDNDSQEEYAPSYPDDYLGYISSEECIRVGLPTNPEWDSLTEEDNYEPEFLEMMHASSENEEQKQKLKTQIPIAWERRKKQQEWQEKYEEYIELIESKIFVALREGKLKATGRLIPAGDEESHYTDFEHTEILADYWKLDKIDWEQSASDNAKGHYCHICVKTEQLLSLFPPPPAEEAKSVHMIAGQYLLDDEEAERVVAQSKRGRPSKNWDGFYVAVMDRLMAGGLPDKQEAFISEMQDWCVKHWGSSPGRSTILEKISPIYKKFKAVKKSENPGR